MKACPRRRYRRYRRARIMGTGRARDYRLEYACYYSLPRNARKNDSRHRARYHLAKRGLVARGDHRVIHHRNGDPLDNRASNLVVLGSAQHRAHHRTHGRRSSS